LTLTLRKERVAENVVADGRSQCSAVNDGGSKVHPPTVALFTTLTRASGTAAPDGSRTTPTIEPGRLGSCESP